MGSVERRLRRLETQAPAARAEEEIRAEACARLSPEDLTVLVETLRRLDELDGGNDSWDAAAWDKLAEAACALCGTRRSRPTHRVCDVWPEQAWRENRLIRHEIRGAVLVCLSGARGMSTARSDS